MIGEALTYTRRIARTLRRGADDPRLPPMPPGQPLIGHARALREDPVHHFVRWGTTVADVVRLSVPGADLAYVFHPDGVRHVLQSNAKNYSKQTRAFAKMRMFLGNGLVTSDGDFWKRQRRIAAPAFHRQRVEAFGDTMTRATADVLARWEKVPAGVSVDVGRELMTLTMRIASETLLGKDLSDTADAVGDAITFLVKNTNDRITRLVDLPLSVPTAENRRYVAAVRTVDAVLTALVAERRRNPGGHQDLLAMLLEARDEETGEGMTDVQLRDEAVTIFSAGHETTSNALAWTFLLLARHPGEAARVYAEVDAALQGRTPTVADLPAMPFARNVIQEAMRLHPPAWITDRCAIADDEVCGYHIPAGTQVLVSPWATHRDPRFWDDPEAFDPDRFTPERSAGRPLFAYFPFGGGPRICIGNAFAMMEAQLLLAQISQRFRLELAPGAHVVEERGVTLRPGPTLPMRPRLRLAAR